MPSSAQTEARSSPAFPPSGTEEARRAIEVLLHDLTDAGGPAHEPPGELLDRLLLRAATARSDDLGVMAGGDPSGTILGEAVGILGLLGPWAPVDRYLARLDSRMLDIVRGRLSGFHPAENLEEIGARWGVSRERIRQLQVEIEATMRGELAPHIGRLGRALLRAHGEVVPTDTLHGAARILAGGSRWRTVLAAAVVRSTGPWLERCGWSVRGEPLAAELDEVRRELVRLAEPHGVLAGEAVEDALCGLVREDPDRFVREVYGFSRVGTTWALERTHRGRVKAALHEIGRPATKPEIAELSRLDAARVGNTLRRTEGVVRADLDHWGFEEWIDEPYEGIFRAIERRIRAQGGQARLDRLLQELPSSFGVSESSVRAFLGSGAFVVENGQVVMNEGDHEARHPRTCPDAVRVGRMWGERIRVTDRHLDGYSLKVHRDVAYANGIRPEDDLLVPVAGHDHSASVIWRRRDPSRRIDVGRVSSLLASIGVEAGALIVVAPGRGSVRIMEYEAV